ncbi:MAG: tRNA pseudouridine(13) synthase TruD [Anaerolineae bacterium]|nr:tRNA pseudouridine(13) synthase TruD [Anaerolineae bacterium]
MSLKKSSITLPTFKLKALNSDFVVDEVYLEPSYTSTDKATHTYLFIQKENITTFSLLHHLARYFNLPEKDVSASGLKDEYAITRQAISLQAIITEAEIEQANDFFANSGLQILIIRIIGYGHEPMHPRYLHGNKFTLTLRQLSPEIANKLIDYLKSNKFFQFINYYDEQRFGLPDSIHNTAQIGKALLADDWATAYHEYLKSGINALEIAQTEAALIHYGSHHEAMAQAAASKLSFFISSYNSRVWNDSLKQNIDQLADVLHVDFPYLGQISLPNEPTAPLPSLLAVNVEKKNWQTGSTYQSKKTRPVVITVPVFFIDSFDDTLHTGDYKAVTVAFYLPTGCYATMMVKQLLLSVSIFTKD